MLDSVDRTTEERLRERIDPDSLDAHVEAFEGTIRESGTDDERAASEYVVDRLTEYGFDAEVREFDAYISFPEGASVTVTTPTRRLVDGITASFGASTPPNGVHGEVVHLPEVTADAVADADVEGRIVFTTGLPTPHPVGLLDDAGARAVVYESVTEGHCHEMIVTPVWGTPSLEDYETIPDLPVAQVSREDGEWLREQCATGPVEARVATAVRTELTTLPCPVGRLDGAVSDRYAVVGNHVDSWHEGITDNATAMAATLELARIVAEADDPPARGLVVGFWPAHSTGRYAGSAWYADDNWLDLRANGVAYYHLDLCGLRGADGIWHQEMAELAAEHRDVIDSATDIPLREGDESFLGSDRPGRNSDQSFWGTGLSSLLSGARLPPGTDEGGPIGGGWWWHTPEDTRDKVDIDVLVEETRIAVTLLARLCWSPTLPHDFSAAADDLRSQVERVETATDHSFEALHADLDALASAVERAQAVAAAVEDPASERARAVEDLQVALGNDLVPALYVGGDDYGQDPALPHQLLPALNEAATAHVDAGRHRERRFAETSLTRAENRLRHRITRATAAVDAFLADVEE
ncbi:M28 family peptidase [Halomarina rubra]|uniref:M28 family peptidase n=1 Tax=Halomarina rubra TaxID=2071873 RepID=A0ABD6AXP2_9EURY|nr:M28 family peptidase [Halomarina rubra]